MFIKLIIPYAYVNVSQPLRYTDSATLIAFILSPSFLFVISVVVPVIVMIINNANVIEQ